MPRSAPQITKADLRKKYTSLPKQTKAKLSATDSKGTPKIFTQIPRSSSRSSSTATKSLNHDSLASEEGDYYTAEYQGQDNDSVEDNSKNENEGESESETEEDEANTCLSPQGRLNLVRVARNFPRVIHIWLNISGMIKAGVEGSIKLDNDRNAKKTWSPAFKANYHLFELLMEHYPEVAAKILGANSTMLSDMEAAMSEGVRGGRSADTNTLKGAVAAHWLPGHAALASVDKTKRGMAHEKTAMALWPQKQVYTNEERKLFESGEKTMKPSAWPSYLFPNAESRLRELFQGRIILSAARMIFVGPSVGSYTSEYRRTVKKSGNALKNQMDTMSSETIAYVATQTYFALNSDGEFDSIGCNSGFSYSTFYEKIIKFLNMNYTVKRRVISHWNGMIFASNASMQDDASDMESLTDNEEPTVD